MNGKKRWQGSIDIRVTGVADLENIQRLWASRRDCMRQWSIFRRSRTLFWFLRKSLLDKRGGVC